MVTLLVTFYLVKWAFVETRTVIIAVHQESGNQINSKSSMRWSLSTLIFIHQMPKEAAAEASITYVFVYVFLVNSKAQYQGCSLLSHHPPISFTSSSFLQLAAVWLRSFLCCFFVRATRLGRLDQKVPETWPEWPDYVLVCNNTVVMLTNSCTLAGTMTGWMICHMSHAFSNRILL